MNYDTFSAKLTGRNIQSRKLAKTKERMQPFSPARAWKGAGEDPSKAVKLARRAAKFARDYMAAFDAGKVPAPDAGDCWGCLMVATDGRAPLGGPNHILDHMKEKYYVPSLLARAIERFPVAPIAKWYVSDKWAGTSNTTAGDYNLHSAVKAQLYKSLYRFCKAELGLAA
jgi:hypothetical protein